jgi:hypothetical protein
MDQIVYQHTQRGYQWTIAAGTIVLVASMITLISGDLSSVGVAAMAVAGVIIGVVVLGASRMTVTVTATEVEATFAFGWPTRRIRRSDIVTHQRVRNSPIYGWGIRWIPNGWMWNVWGLDAIELTLVSGRYFRIGTDDPVGLDAVLQR